MCFSATASFVAGGVLVGSGAVTLKQVKHKREIALASIPLLFGVQQLVEGVVWLSLGQAHLNSIMAHAYVFFSHILWPTLVPVAVLMLEKDPKRRLLLQAMLIAGLGVSLYLAFQAIAYPLTCQVIGNSLVYRIQNPGLPLTALVYGLATCGALIVSSHGALRQIGLIFLISLILSAFIFTTQVVSVWCFFASLVSLLIFYYFKRLDPKR